MNILNGNEAFAALMAGKNIMCRAAGGLIEFDDLDQFPATVFAMPDYEFCIKIDEISINGYTFLKPYSLEELSAGQDIFLLGNTGTIVKGQFIPEYEELVLAVKNGSVQRNFESAQNQAKAMQSLLGINNDLVLKVVDFHEFMKPLAKSKKTTRKKSNDPQTENSTSEVNAHKNDQENITEPAPKTRPAFTVDEFAEIEIDPTSIIEKFAAQIASCKTTEAVLSLRPVFFANGNLGREHTQHLCKLTEDKLLELDPEQYSPKVINADHQIYIDGINACNSEEEINTTLYDLNDQGFSAEQISEITLAKNSKLAEFQTNALINIEEKQYNKLLSELLERAGKANSPAEANALYKYTTSWSEDQRKPLVLAIHKRLAELSPPEKSQSSLMVRIQEAKTFIDLAKLEEEITQCDPAIHERLLSYANQRRTDLTMATDTPWETK
ncbi:hypothetical protein I5729_12470 [Acinetobacter bereziniae]|uniref:hypothetical protein n=1 Tax=Acinetobacter bereziniae TaxID=106648 RepID=UPI0018FF9A1B|nr:hypothetical protein [Acinetobacter bereziniae]MBJ9949908.1 hypothetical protein [Acinetobacter bereziniae]